MLIQIGWSLAILRSLLVGVAVATVALLTGCGAANVVALHSPMHPTNTQQVTLRGDAAGQVDKVELSVERYALSVAADGTLTQTLAAAEAIVKTCDPSGTVSSLNCSHTMSTAFPANSLVKFSAKAFDGSGKTSTESYSFAAGDYPLPNDPIPIRLKGETVKSFDVIFIPDTDITVNSFRDQLDEVIENLYFKYFLVKTWRGLYNFYYSGVQGNYEELCNFTNPSNMANLTAVADTVAILHQTNLRDCRSGMVMSSEINYDKTLIHETGHALFNVKDEYCCDSSYSQQTCERNLWSSLSNCQADAPTIGYPTTNCTQLTNGTTTLNFWRIDPAGAGGCIMGPNQHNSDSDFAKACSRRINWRVGKCIGGNCYPSPECP
jgi:hypothetical protein